MPGLISCVIPTYNRPEMLGNVLDQLFDYDNIEIIIVNDGGSPIQGFGKYKSAKIAHIINLPENSRSVSIPRNIGISWAIGEFIAHIDDDIKLLDGRFNPLKEALQAAPSKMLAHGNRITSMQGTTAITIDGKSNWDPTQPNGWGVDGSQFIYRSSVYKDIPYVFCRRACDYELAKAIATKYGSHSLIHVDCMTSVYNWHGKNRSLDDSNKKLEIYPAKFRKYFSNPKIDLPEVV